MSGVGGYVPRWAPASLGYTEGWLAVSFSLVIGNWTSASSVEPSLVICVVRPRRTDQTSQPPPSNPMLTFPPSTITGTVRSPLEC